MSRRTVDWGTGLGVPEISFIMTGSIRTREESNRGCIMQGCTLRILSQDRSILERTDLQLRAPHAVSYTDDGARHGFPKVIDHKKQIPRVVKPGGYTSSHHVSGMTRYERWA